MLNLICICGMYCIQVNKLFLMYNLFDDTNTSNCNYFKITSLICKLWEKKQFLHLSKINVEQFYVWGAKFCPSPTTMFYLAHQQQPWP